MRLDMLTAIERILCEMVNLIMAEHIISRVSYYNNAHDENILGITFQLFISNHERCMVREQVAAGICILAGFNQVF